MISDLEIVPRSTSEAARPRSLRDVVEGGAVVDFAPRGLGLGDVGEHDLPELPLFGRGQLVLALLIGLFGVLVGHLRPFRDLFGRHHDERDLAEFGRAKLDLVGVKIARQLFRRWRIDGSGLGCAEFDIVDGALLVLETVQRLEERFRGLDACRHRAGDLAAQRHMPLLGDIALLGEPDLADHAGEARRIEGTVSALEVGIAHDLALDLVIGLH